MKMDRDKKVVQHGGSWNGLPRGCRSAFRYPREPVNADSNIGFRVVCLPPLDASQMLRGGSWDFFSSYCRSAFCVHDQPDDPDSHVGFRVVCLPQVTP